MCEWFFLKKFLLFHILLFGFAEFMAGQAYGMVTPQANTTTEGRDKTIKQYIIKRKYTKLNVLLARRIFVALPLHSF